MLTNTKLVLAAAIILGAASAALANDIETNPSEAQSAREWRDFLAQGQNHNHMGGGTGDGYFASPTQQEDLSQSGRKSRNH
jgi:hypothetical protein